MTIQQSDIVIGKLLRSNYGCGPISARIQGVFSDGSVALRRWRTNEARYTPFALTAEFLCEKSCGWAAKEGAGT